MSNYSSSYISNLEVKRKIRQKSQSFKKQNLP